MGSDKGRCTSRSRSPKAKKKRKEKSASRSPPRDRSPRVRMSEANPALQELQSEIEAQKVKVTHLLHLAEQQKKKANLQYYA